MIVSLWRFELRVSRHLESVKECQVTGAEDVSLLLGRALEMISTPEWVSLCTGRHSVLLEGSDESTESVVLFLAPYLCRPVVWKPRHAPVALPSGGCGALVLQNVGALSRPEQAELLRWLENSSDRTQVVSTTVQPLFPLVERGLFDEALYYRLNIMLLCVDAGDSGGNPAAPSLRWENPSRTARCRLSAKPRELSS
jgi:hypothetical protein